MKELAVAPLEKIFGKFATLFEEFIHYETVTGLLLMACAIIAFITVNFTFNPEGDIAAGWDNF